MNWFFTYQIISSPAAVSLVVASSYLLGYQTGKQNGIKRSAKYLVGRLRAGCIAARGRGYIVQQIEGEFRDNKDLHEFLSDKLVMTEVTPRNG